VSDGLCQHCGQAHEPAAEKCPTTGWLMTAPGLIGTRVDRYEVQRLLGVGGFGSVYRARHVHTDATVALKLLKRELNADASMIERFMREAKAASAVGNEHIVGVLDAGIAPGGQAFLVLEFLDGWDLKELVFREGPQRPQRLVEIALQALDGLAAAHARGVVHRDMKPANVFIVQRGGKDFVKVLDFGISKMHQEQGKGGLTLTGVAIGTPSYMAPEQFFDARSVDGRSDLYSVSVMLYELLAARLPFEAKSYAELVVKVRTEVPPPLSTIAPMLPATLCLAIDKGLARDREQRWPTAQQFSEALKAAIEGGLPMKPFGAKSQPSYGTASMLMDKTATPQPQKVLATPVPARATFGPAPAAPPPAPAAQVTPASFGQSQAPIAPSTPLAVTGGPRALSGGPPKPASKMWLWILLGLGIASCCTCGSLAAIANAQKQGHFDAADN
jgi:serine/threonine-protein kinase